MEKKRREEEEKWMKKVREIKTKRQAWEVVGREKQEEEDKRGHFDGEVGWIF